MVNRLAHSKSLYLRKHADNPIDWWSWSEDALETAKQENKPIFLSIGYSSCHWCTVMEGEAFSDEAIAEYMNANFLPIKVDREERPDIDSIYMQALQMMTGQGGWPLNIFLTPDDRVPFYGGTYFPLEPRYGRPGFLQVLQAIRRYYDTEKEKLHGFKQEIMGYMQQAAQIGAGEALSDDLLWRGLEVNTGAIATREYGPSFPMMPYAQLVLQGTRFEFESRYNLAEAATQRGLDLALGGIYDVVAGGFHRYTVDPTWTVPHFEKMLYDNGQILEYLANLWGAGVRETAFEEAIRGTIAWLQQEMRSPEGYFWAAQDADSFTTPDEAEPEEGAFYVWSYRELERRLTREGLEAIADRFDVSPEGNFEGKNVLQRRDRRGIDPTTRSALDELFAGRYGKKPAQIETFPPARDNQEAKTKSWPGRIPPVTDTKAIAAWNALAISGLSRAAAVFRERSYLELARQGADFILAHHWVDGRFHRLNYAGEADTLAQSEDYAFLIKALLDVQQASLSFDGDTEDVRLYLDKAIAVQAEFDELLWGVELGGYFNTTGDRPDAPIVRERSYTDNATPAANGVAIANLVRLALLADNLDYLDRAEAGLKAFSSIMHRSPSACPSLFAALDGYRHPTLVRTTRDRLGQLMSEYHPTAVFQEVADLPEGAIALVCEGLTCKSPAMSEEQLTEQLAKAEGRAV
ncbi:MAG: thioredoxin domain-containing protein [Cyanobacteria bacterium J007]|nr:MAG: thioredoxin domain-containing protein [Cyanobacteria bacterium J007]